MENFKKYKSICTLYSAQTFDGGILYVLGGYAVKFLQLIIFLTIWKSLLSSGADTYGMTLPQVLTYYLLSSIFREQLNLVSSGVTLLWEGSIVSNYIRPLPILSQLAAETAGKWIPPLLLFSVPVFFTGLAMGINVFPVSVSCGILFVLSLALSISLGFAIDFIFVSLAVYIKNASYTTYIIRNAITQFFSGAVIPFALMPWNIGEVLKLTPFGSTASAPLSIYVGTGNPMELLFLQLLWNILLWPITILLFKRSQERMISYGG